VLTRVVSVWNARTFKSHITCMYSLRLSPSGMRMSIAGESELFRLNSPMPAFASAACFWRCSIVAMRRSTERTLSRYSSSFSWSVFGNLRLLSGLSGLAEESVQHGAGVDLGRPHFLVEDGVEAIKERA
jgi:hypothetical protein